MSSSSLENNCLKFTRDNSTTTKLFASAASSNLSFYLPDDGTYQTLATENYANKRVNSWQEIYSGQVTINNSSWTKIQLNTDPQNYMYTTIFLKGSESNSNLIWPVMFPTLVLTKFATSTQYTLYHPGMNTKIYYYRAYDYDTSSFDYYLYLQTTGSVVINNQLLYI